MVQCAFCGNLIEETCSKCPHCGSVNASVRRFTDDTPQTIAALKTWYEAHRLPPYEVTRFFIGVDTPAPKAFGICTADRQTLLYKNLPDGTRTVLYHGPDEAYAAAEFYRCLKQEILKQKAGTLQKK